MNFQIQIIKTEKEFVEIKDKWDVLLSRSIETNIFLSWEWMYNWWVYFGKKKELNIVVLKKNDELVAILPLYLRYCGIGPFKIPVLENIGNPQSDYTGFIIDAKKVEESFRYISGYIYEKARKGCLIRFKEVPKESKSYEVLTAILKNKPDLFSREIVLTTAPYLLLNGKWDDYLKNLKKKRRGNLLRAFRDLNLLGSVSLDKVKADSLSEALEIIVSIHSKRWSERRIKGIFYDKKIIKFYSDATYSFNGRKWLDFSLLKVDGLPISAVLGFKFEGKFYYSITAMDPVYSKYSIGHLHIMMLLEEAYNEELKEFDFLRGDESYKFHWANNTRCNLLINITKRSFLAELKISLIEILFRLDELKKRGLKENYFLMRDKIRLKKVKERNA